MQDVATPLQNSATIDLSHIANTQCKTPPPPPPQHGMQDPNHQPITTPPQYSMQDPITTSKQRARPDHPPTHHHTTPKQHAKILPPPTHHAPHHMMLAQFTLSSQPVWSGQDGKFDYQDFVDMLFQIFKQGDKWTNETIWWWNIELFGNENGLRSVGSAKGATSGFLAKVKDQSKDHHAEKEVQEEVPKQTSVKEPSPWDKDDSNLTDTTDAGRNDPSDTLPSPLSPRSQTAGVH
ncbi:hypothetical protein H4582DRAFT_2063689 [Lactarius indigo]|nr:hypothetical protein H4582DRAFT_2063689 [Lactarius indigo]